MSGNVICRADSWDYWYTLARDLLHDVGIDKLRASKIGSYERCGPVPSYDGLGVVDGHVISDTKTEVLYGVFYGTNERCALARQDVTKDGELICAHSCLLTMERLYLGYGSRTSLMFSSKKANTRRS